MGLAVRRRFDCARLWIGRGLRGTASKSFEFSHEGRYCPIAANSEIRVCYNHRAGGEPTDRLFQQALLADGLRAEDDVGDSETGRSAGRRRSLPQ